MAKDAADKLRGRREKLEAELAVLREQERTAAQRWHEIAGRAVLDHAAKNPAFREQLDRVLDAELTKVRERKLFGLPVSAGRGRGETDAASATSEPGEDQVGESRTGGTGP